FGGQTSIGGSVTGGAGASFNFNSNATITGGLQGSGSAFNFSQTAPTVIGGDIDLNNGSSIGGGSAGTPIQIGGNAQVSTGSTLGGNLNILGILSSIG